MACVLGSMQCSTSNSCGRGGLTVRACFMKSDHYSVLGVRKNASKTEIKTAYRRLARRYHPDVCKDRGSEQKFKQIHTAYETIINNQSCLQHEVCLDSSLEALFQSPISEVVPDIFYSNDWFEGLDFNNPTYPHSPMAHGSMEGEGFFEEIEKEQYKKAEDFAPWMAY